MTKWDSSGASKVYSSGGKWREVLNGWVGGEGGNDKHFLTFFAATQALDLIGSPWLAQVMGDPLGPDQSRQLKGSRKWRETLGQGRHFLPFSNAAANTTSLDWVPMGRLSPG